MATFYLDLLNGNDSNDGTTFANRWKTFSSGATAARIAPGDTIRIMQSGIPTTIGSATWTLLSTTVTLGQELTKNIDMCDAAWTSNDATNISCSTNSTSYKEGTACATFVVGTNFTTGLMAYKNLGSAQDFSNYQQISFWIKSTTAISSNMLKISLCSGTNGTTEVNQFVVPDMLGTNAYWTLLTLDYGGALGNSIQSIGLFALLDPGTPTISLDCVIACKANSAENSLTMSDLISKNTTDETWWPIQSINGTTIKLDNHTNATPLTARGYIGTTETCTTYKIKTINQSRSSSLSSSMNAITDTGTFELPITYSGGWDTTNMTSQTGMTFIDGANSLGYGLRYGSTLVTGITINNLHFCRFYQGITISEITNWIRYTSNIYICGCQNYGLVIYGNNNTSDYTIFVNSGNYCGLFIYGTNSILNNVKCYNMIGFGIALSGTNNTVNNFSSINNSTYGVNLLVGATNNKLYNGIIYGNGTFGVYSSAADNYLINTIINQPTECFFSSTNINYEVQFIKYNQIEDKHVYYSDGLIISSEYDSYSTNSTSLSWKINSINTTRNFYYPAMLNIAKIYCLENKLVTISAYIKKTHKYCTALLFVPGLQPGINTDIYVESTGTEKEYNLTTLTFTPTETGVIEVFLKCYDNYFPFTVYISNVKIYKEI